MNLRSLTLMVFLSGAVCAQEADKSPHAIQFITVDKDVKLEILDWGGSGRPLVLLAGNGNDAHIFDGFAPKLVPAYHVYGITRRGFGASSVPASGYSPDRLGDDVLAVLDSLKLNRPVLAGHSIAGEELSSIGSRHPEKVAGLIYLDAGYGYAVYDSTRGDFNIDLFDLLEKLPRLLNSRDPRQLLDELLTTSLPRFEQDLRERQADLAADPPQPAPPRTAPRNAPTSPTAPTPAVRPNLAIITQARKYTGIRDPTLAIFASPHDPGPPMSNDPTRLAAFQARDKTRVDGIAAAFEKGVPDARVVRLPNANHYVFFSNEADVLREMNAFIANLPVKNEDGSTPR
jgi:pimeloyl-ACP methyl ester carboxylesterase